MKKRIFSLIVVLIMMLSFSSCVISEKKYDYNMEKYITLPNYDGFKVTMELDSIQSAIDKYLMDYSTEYIVRKGDNVYIDVVAYDIIYHEGENGTVIDQKSEQPIEALKKENMLLSNVGAGSYAQKAELSIIGTEIGEKTQLKTILPDNFEVEEYRGKEVFLDITIKSRECVAGDVALIDYTGYYLDKDGNKILDENAKEDAKEKYKTFDSNTNAKFYLGSKMSIDGFEENIIGMLVGDTKSFKATFPDDYSNEDVKGQTVEFKVKVNELYTPPIYNDDFVKTHFSEYKTTEAFENALKDQYILSAVYEHVVSNCKIIKYPKAELKSAKNELKEIEKSFVETYGVELDAYIEAYFSMTRDEYIKSNMKSEMIYYAIGQKEKLVPTAEQLIKETDSLIAYYKEYYMVEEKLDENSAKVKATEFVARLGESYTYENVLFTMVDDLLIEKAEVTEKERTYVSITETLAEADKPVTE